MDPKMIGLFAVAGLLVGYGMLSIGMYKVREDSESSGSFSDLLRPSLPRQAMYEPPRDLEGGKRTKRILKANRKYSKKV